jgi:hypothetical protein
MRPEATSACGLKAAGGKGLGALHLFLFFHPQGSHIPASRLTPEPYARAFHFFYFFSRLKKEPFFLKQPYTAFVQPSRAFI